MNTRPNPIDLPERTLTQTSGSGWVRYNDNGQVEYRRWKTVDGVKYTTRAVFSRIDLQSAVFPRTLVADLLKSRLRELRLGIQVVQDGNPHYFLHSSS